MKKIIIDFKMISIDSKIEFTTTGEFENQRLKFKDKESSIHIIFLKGNKIKYYKKGSMDMKFEFDRNSYTKGKYMVDNNNFEFDIITTKLENIKDKLIIEYNLIQNNETVNRSTLVIKYSTT